MAMASKKYRAVIKDFASSVDRFGEALEEEKNDFLRDSSIKRFELAFDLAWKTIKAWAEDRGVDCSSPKGCFRTAFREGLITYDEYWLKLVETRNDTVHTYKEDLAEKVYGKLPKALKSFRELLKSLTMSEKDAAVKGKKKR